jgi:ribosome maturation factor RimP
MAVDLFFIEEQIQGLLAAKFQEETFQDCFLVEINLHQGNKLEVFVDCDSGLTLDKCQQLSRYLESHIDEAGWLGESYVLEVSSPGLGRPLKLLRQYQKNIGRKVEATLKENGSIKTGILKTVSEGGFTIEETLKVKEGNKNIKKTVLTELPFDSVKKTMIVISF